MLAACLPLRLYFKLRFPQLAIFRVCCNICLNKIESIGHRPLKFLPLILRYIIDIFGYG